MYQLDLSESHVPAQLDAPVLETTVGGVLREMAAEHPEAELLREIITAGEVGRRWTYGALLEESEQLARAFASRFQKGEKVTIWAPNMPEWVLVQFACALSGVVLVTANPAYQSKELRYVLEQSGSVALFMIDEYRGNPMARIAAEATSGNARLREIVDLSDHDALYLSAGNVAELPDVMPADAALMLYTSGTTGVPKGTVLSHRAITNNARFHGERAGAQAGDIWPLFVPLFHAAGCMTTLLAALQTGVSALIFKGFDPELVLKQIEAEKLTALIGVPTMFVALMEAQKAMQVDVSSVRMAISGGAMVAPELVRNVRAVFACGFETVYALTECSPLITQHFPSDRVEDICNSVGQPLPQTEVTVRSTVDNSVLPVGQVGEICARGYLLMEGYHANPSATAEVIDPAGWLHTGDLGVLDRRGYLSVTGRVKDMIIRGGQNLYPVEIENVIVERPDVAEVAVVGLPDAQWGEIVACFMRPESEGAVDAAALRAHCRALLAPQKTPEIWVEVSGFPLTGPGKIQKFALREGYLAGQYQALDVF